MQCYSCADETFAEQIAGAVVGVVGTILCATAKSINVLIVANAICGFANATQLSFHVVMGELVPIKYRYLINAILYSKQVSSTSMAFGY